MIAIHQPHVLPSPLSHLKHDYRRTRTASSMDAFTKILLYLLFIPLFSSAQQYNCPLSYCGQNLNNVRFPFRLIGQQPQNCGFPGFNLRCDRPSTMLIDISTSGEFAVRSINYRSQAVRIYDPSNCLPARLFNVDFFNSPFTPLNLQNYTLLRCPNDASLSRFTTIDCLSNSSFSTLAVASMSVARSIVANQTGCQIAGAVMLPVIQQSNQNGFPSRIEDYVTLTWSAPNCDNCEAAGVPCGYVNSTTSETKCFFDYNGVPKASHVFKIIAFAMAIPAMAASLMIACLMCAKDRRRSGLMTTGFNTTTVAPVDDAVVPPPVVGLDQTTIESYTKVELGESKRLPGHDDAVCPICLSEYHVKETVRCIPECLHCFHAECIDEWLKMNGSCPICRNSPSPVHDDHVES